MLDFKLAQARFRKTRDPDSAVRYHRLAWDAYLHGDLPKDCMFNALLRSNSGCARKSSAPPGQTSLLRSL